MTANHTPGPYYSARFAPFSKGIVAVVHSPTGEDQYVVSNSDVASFEVEGNAAMFAAAPEMLEALKPFAAAAAVISADLGDGELLFAHYPSLFGGETELRVGDLRRALAALAKAEGR
jgi:hypothetical protein